MDQLIIYLYYYLRNFPCLGSSILIPKIPSIYYSTKFSTNKINMFKKKKKKLPVEFHFPYFTPKKVLLICQWRFPPFQLPISFFFFLLQQIIFKFHFSCFTLKKCFNLFIFFPFTTNYN